MKASPINIVRPYLKTTKDLFYVYKCLTCIYVCAAHKSLMPEKNEEVIRSLETEVTDNYKPTCGC